MRSRLLSFLLTIIVLVTAVFATDTNAVAESNPEFKLGFKALADQVPSVVGKPAENEHWGPNGDSLQQTTTGLMVWRKADNWTAFTNGSRTWVNGPNGVAERSNEERFEWEAAATQATATPVPSVAPTSAALPTPTPAPTPVFHPELKTMSDQAAWVATPLADLVRQVDSEWASAYGWRPSRPVAVSVFGDAAAFVSAIASLGGSDLTEAQKRNLSFITSAYVTPPSGDWAVLVNASQGVKTTYTGWKSDDPRAYETAFLRDYASLMFADLGLDKDPKSQWFRIGFTDLLVSSKVPNPQEDARGQDYLRRGAANPQGPWLLYPLRDLQDNFNTQLADGVALVHWEARAVVGFLSQGQGPDVPMKVLRTAASGRGFEAALKTVTGYSLDQLDAAYRSAIR